MEVDIQQAHTDKDSAPAAGPDLIKSLFDKPHICLLSCHAIRCIMHIDR